ncbi:MAG TPA: hypothetical protein VL691_00525, partial [Vicinamibacteria bacterium]|nr:hypothetical protein [Vicinamibacteria bacterium]
WIEKHEKTLYEPRAPDHPIGVYFSPETRNTFTDAFLRSFQGTAILLLQAHLEMQIVTPRTLVLFRGSTLILPDVRLLGEAERSALRAQVSRGMRLVVTGTNATGLPASEALAWFPECPGSAYLAALEKDFQETNPSAATDFIKGLAADPPVRIEASSSVATQIARVGGTLHIFFANFEGLVAGQNAVQTPQKGIRVTVPAAYAGRAWFLPFMGEPIELQGRRENGSRVLVLPEIQKGAVLWFEDR